MKSKMQIKLRLEKLSKLLRRNCHFYMMSLKMSENRGLKLSKKNKLKSRNRLGMGLDKETDNRKWGEGLSHNKQSLQNKSNNQMRICLDLL